MKFKALGGVFSGTKKEKFKIGESKIFIYCS
jgi:hypothetical protein